MKAKELHEIMAWLEGAKAGADPRSAVKKLMAESGELMSLAAKASLWRHHEDCNPLSEQGCRCGLWKIQEFVSAR